MGKKKRIIKLRLWVKVVLAIIITLIVIYSIKGHFKGHIDTINVEVVEIGGEEPKEEEEPFKEVLEVAEEVQAPEVVEESNSYTTRMTSYWANDGYGTGECTGSGLCSWNFQINDKGWYTYQGKLVVATATTYLANQGWQVGNGVHLYKYYNELTLTIDGTEYDAIILDSCGSSMKNDRVDLFVSGAWAVKDTMIEVRVK